MRTPKKGGSPGTIQTGWITGQVLYVGSGNRM